MMRPISLLVLLALFQSHAVIGFVVLPPPPAGFATTTELNLLRKDGKVRTGFRSFRGFVKRRILRRPQLDEYGMNPQLENAVEMREESSVQNMAPVVPAHIIPSIEEDVVIIQAPTTPIEDEPVFVIREAIINEEEEEQVVLEVEETPVVVEEEVEAVATEAETDVESDLSSYTERSTKNLLEARLASNAQPKGTYTERSTRNLLEARLAMAKTTKEASSEEIDIPAAVKSEPLVAEEPVEVVKTEVIHEEPVIEEEESVVVEIGVIVKAVDQLFAMGKAQLAMHTLKESNVDVRSSGPLYWRFVKAHYELFSNTQDKAQQQAFLEKGLQLVDAAPLEFEQDTNTKAFLLKWKAILLGKLGGFQNTKDKMANSFVIKESLEEAQQLLQSIGEEDSSIYQALGEWCFKVAGISFLERQAASVLFGKPPASSYTEALKFFLQGYKLKSTPALAIKVSETYQKMGQRQLANEWSQKAVAKEEVLLP